MEINYLEDCYIPPFYSIDMIILEGIRGIIAKNYIFSIITIILLSLLVALST